MGSKKPMHPNDPVNRSQSEPTDPATRGLPNSLDPANGSPRAPRARPRHWAWAQLMQRAFGVDALACPRCAGRLRLMATVDDPHAIRAIMETLGLPAEVPQPDSPQPPPPGVRELLADVHS